MQAALRILAAQCALPSFGETRKEEEEDKDCMERLQVHRHRAKISSRKAAGRLQLCRLSVKSARMEQLMIKIIALVLVSYWVGQAKTDEDFCYKKQCPEYRQLEKNEVFEKRLYYAAYWTTTKVDGTGSADVMAAHARLKGYFQGHGWATDKNYPVLVNVTERGGPSDYSLSWFVPPGNQISESSDPSVTLELKPEAIFYVMFFHGTPSVELCLQNANILREALVTAVKTFDPHTYIGAGYESYFSILHHNEVWIPTTADVIS
ncbi:uncharacterized protein [Embiotoca jacksoni]|uniref:uncharacterized protein isoform X1 n=2 Tax=Embiotoca jacksoni TaxID=100190 RepID=UPI00370465EC